MIDRTRVAFSSGRWEREADAVWRKSGAMSPGWRDPVKTCAQEGVTTMTLATDA